jgi:hypothetical protein
MLKTKYATIGNLIQKYLVKKEEPDKPGHPKALDSDYLKSIRSGTKALLIAFSVHISPTVKRSLRIQS